MRPRVPALVLLALLPSAASGQDAPLPDMETIARALGVSCEYCHARDASGPEPAARERLQIARGMIAMTHAANEQVQAAIGRPAATRVQCATCHRGVPIPMPLAEIVLRTTLEKGGAAAADQYRDLRRRYYGRASYDFGEDELLRAIERLVNARPSDAIALIEMNLELHPQSSASYVALAQAHVRRRDPDAAIAALEKALEIDPANAFARGRLAQLLDDRRRR